MKKIKRLLASLMVVAMLLTTAPLSGFVGLELPNIFDIFASAAETYSGTCGDNLTWTFDEETGTLTISGEGDMYDYDRDFYYYPWETYVYAIKTVIIGNSVATIGSFAFYDCTSITSVTIPDSVTSIGYCAFEGCTGLTNITIPNSVTSIDNFAFCYCESLTSITIPDSVTSIGDGAFDLCNSLTSIIVDGANTAYSSDTYGVLFDKNKTKLIRYPVSNSRKIYSIPDSVTSIYIGAFDYGTNLTNITIPDSVTSIGNGAFERCTSLTSIEIPYGVTSIGYLVFLGCTSLTSIEIPYSVTCIDSSAFSGCTSLTSIEIPYSVTRIDSSAFSGCTSLTSIEIPYSVTRIGEWAFRNCYSLTDVYYSGTYEEWQKISIGTYNECLTNATIHYGSVGPDVPSIEETITGKLAFATGSAWSGTEDYTYKYSDSFFNYDSTKYHHDLALMSLCLEASACVPDGGWKKDASGKMVRSGDDYSGKYPANSEALFKNIGFETWKPYGYNVKPGYDTVACAIGAKNISDTDTVIAVAVRGAGYEAEWGGNFNMGKSSVNHEGFNKAKKGVLGYIEEFVAEYGHTFGENVKFWIVGYSRGAATANLVAAEFNKGLSATYAKTKALNVTKNNLYCYTFETPQNTTDKDAKTSAYNNIFSIVNPIDPVPKVAPASKGFDFGRYGVTYYLPATETISNYNGKNGIKSKMNSVHKDIYGEDYTEDFIFSEIDMSILGDIEIDENKSVGQMTFMNNLIDIIATQALDDRENYYYNYQGAIQDLMAMFMGGYKTPDAKALGEELKNVLSDYWNNKEFISVHPIEKLKKKLATVIAENTEVSYDDAYNLLSEIDSLLFTIIKNPDYAFSVYNNGYSLIYPHEGHVLVGWMAYLDTLPQATRAKLLSTSLKYRTVKVNCPVDVNVYDSEGNLVASIIDDEVISIDGEYLSTYIDENGQKCVVMPFDEEYRIEVTAREDCEVTCSVTETDAETLRDEKVVNYYEIQVDKDETITCTAENADVDGEVDKDCLYPITEENGDSISPDEEMYDNGIETFEITTLSNIDGINPIGGGEYNKGEFAQVTAFDITGYIFDGWYNGDTLVTNETEYRFCVFEDTALTAVYTKDPYSGTCGDNLYWSFNEETGELLILGTGKMKDYSATEPAPWDEYKDQIKKIIVSEGVTTIGNDTFIGCKNLKEVSLPSTLTKIGDSAFRDCVALDEIEIPETVKSLGHYAFYGCTGLKDINVGDSVQTIGNYAFRKCSNLKSVTLPDTLTRIGKGAFMECPSLFEAEYKGTDEQWTEVTVGENNEALLDALKGIVLGDVNGDGKINSLDALYCLNHSTGKKVLEGKVFTTADVDKNGKINSMDALIILQFAVGIRDSI